MHNELDAARRELLKHAALRGAPSVGAVATAALGQGPKKFVYVRDKEGPKELIPRYGLVSESLTTYLDLTESALRSFSAENWERLRSYPMIVETLCDHNETRQSLVVVATGARHWACPRAAVLEGRPVEGTPQRKKKPAASAPVGKKRCAHAVVAPKNNNCAADWPGGTPAYPQATPTRRPALFCNAQLEFIRPNVFLRRLHAYVFLFQRTFPPPPVPTWATLQGHLPRQAAQRATKTPNRAGARLHSGTGDHDRRARALTQRRRCLGTHYTLADCHPGGDEELAGPGPPCDDGIRSWLGLETASGRTARGSGSTRERARRASPASFGLQWFAAMCPLAPSLDRGQPA